MNKKKLLLFLVVLTLIFSATSTALAQSDWEKTLIIAADSDPASIDPTFSKAYPVGSEIIINVFDTLVAWEAPDFDKLEGRLAESWSISEDGKVYTFDIRQGVTFHDGSAVNAESVMAALNRTKNESSYMNRYFGYIVDMKAVSEYVLEITLEKPISVFLSWLAMPEAAIVSTAAVESMGEDFSTHPVGSGPFVFQSWIPDTEVVLTANANYWRGAPKIETIVYRIIPDASTRRLELESGSVDISQQNGQLYSLPVEDMKAFESNPDIKVIMLPSQIIRELAFNNNSETSSVRDLKVRQAMAYAVDYDGIVEYLLGGTASRVMGPLTTNNWAFSDAVLENSPFTYSPEKAKQLLSEAGYAEGDLNFKLYTFQGTLWGMVATFLQENFANVGINVEIVQMEFPPFRDIVVAGDFDIYLGGRQPWYNDPEAHITIDYLSSLADTAMTFRMPPNEALDQKILEAQAASDQEERKALYADIQKEIVDFVPGLYLFSPNVIIFQRTEVKGLVVNSAPPLNEYWSVYKEKH